MISDFDRSRPWATTLDGAPVPATGRFARHMRREPTDAERKLWLHLRRLAVPGSHFRRQMVIGSFIADFACLRSRLIVEVDGGQHAENAADAERTAALEAQGWSVLRFWNTDVLSNIDGVLEAIAAAVAARDGASRGATPTPHPSPQGGGE